MKEVSSMRVFLDEEKKQLVFQYNDDPSYSDYVSSKDDVHLVCGLYGDFLLEEILYEQHGFYFEE